MIPLARRSLGYYWRTNLAVVLGVATAVAVLAGALIVGDSVRGSLRDQVLQRLGRTHRLVASSGFFREALGSEMAADPQFKRAFAAVCPLISVPGTVSDQETNRRAARVQVYGVDDRFWTFHGVAGISGPGARDAFVSAALARDIGVAPGHAVLVRVERPSAVPIESLHGRKDNIGRTLRLTAREIIDAAHMGDFSLQAQQGEVRAVFVPLRRLQEVLGVSNGVNALLFTDADASAGGKEQIDHARELDALLSRYTALADVGLSVRGDVVESAAGVMDGPRAKAVGDTAAATGLVATPVFTYLANTIRSGGTEVPYSLVSAIDFNLITNEPVAASNPPPIALNDWTARALNAHVGDAVTIDYYLWEEPGSLVTRSADFRLAAIVPIAGLAAARDLAPTYPGITEAKTLSQWDPPFPVDLRRIRKADEDYWDRYRTTPKAFIPFDVGQKLWQSRFGDRTSVRLVSLGDDAGGARDRFATALRTRIEPARFGFTTRAVRDEGLRAAKGATDFGEYFTYFSFFLVGAALLLAAMFFRLTVEQRARETGLLRAVGFSPARVRRLLLTEGLLLAVAGSVIGAVGAVGYGALMMLGLRTWWSGAVGTTSLRLHVTPMSIALGVAGALAAAMLCIWWTLRRLSRVSERSLLAGQVAQDVKVAQDFSRGTATPKARTILYAAPIATLVCAIAAAALIVAAATTSLDRTAAFFGSGMLLLVSGLCAANLVLRRPPHSVLAGAGWPALGRIGLRNATDRPGRSVLAIGVIASATFLLVAVSAFQRDPRPSSDRRSGTGGYGLLVDLLLPIASDPNSRDGLEALGLTTDAGVSIEPLRVQPGDDASCLNLYEPTNPRILGVTRKFIAEGRFTFQSSLASTDAERVNPWLLLERDLGADVVPVAADANSMTYVLHKNLGDEIVSTQSGRPIRLRLVAALADSIFQRELLMTGTNFVRLFPRQEGYRALLIEGARPAGGAGQAGQAGGADRVDGAGGSGGFDTRSIEAAVESGAADLGADAVETSVRLAEFHAVENTYLATFQALGGLGLLVGTLGLTAIVLRNVLERRRELALLGAVGYRPSQIFVIVVAENLLLLVWGLAIGAVCAVIAIGPALLERGGGLSNAAPGAMLLVAVFLAGLLSSLAAARAALHSPMLEALRSE